MPSATTTKLTVEQTSTGYWTVQRGGVQLAGAATRSGAEREREMLLRLSLCCERRAGSRASVKA